jgi:pSer/pThr/pTyr-binding forkhead associated (FHA) protein
MPKLTWVVQGESSSVDVGDSCSIGSLAGSTVVLDSALGVSRRHCQILKIQNGYEIADLGSTNGTKVNGSVVKKQKLANGDRIEVGKVVLTYDDGSGASNEDEISLEEPAGAPSASAPSRGAASSGSSAGSSDQCMVVFAGGDQDGKKIPLDKPRVTFGRNAKNTVVLSDSNASGFHCEIAREGGAYVLRDLGSTNGTLVDGEPVSEMALQHGARIRMGATRLVFVDPTVSDFEKAMSSVDDLGSEWGLLRAEMDMSRVQQARRSQFILITVVLVVVVGGGAFVMANRDMIGPKRSLIASVTGTATNSIKDFSFEENGGSDWSPRPDTPTKARGASTSSADGEAKQGTAFYAVSRSGAGGICAAARHASKITVNPTQAVEFGGSVRTRDGALAGFRVVWFDASGKEIGRSSSKLESSDKWTEVKSVALPPAGASAAGPELINAADGTAFFDDVLFVETSTKPAGGDVKDGAVELSTTADAQISVSREGVKLLGGGAVVGGALRADAIGDSTVRGDRSGSQSIREVRAAGSVAAAGDVVDPVTNTAKPFTITMTPKGARLVEVTATLPGDSAFIATLPDEYITAGIGVRTDIEFRRAADPHLFDKVVDVSFGGPHRFKVSRAEGASALRVALYHNPDGWEVSFGAADGNLKMVIDTDSQALIEEIHKFVTEAESARQRREFGKAISKLRQLAALYPSGSPEQTRYDKEASDLDAAGRTDLEKLTNGVGGAVKFRDEKELSDAVKEAQRLTKEYAEHDVGTKAAPLGETAAAEKQKVQLARFEFQAAPLLLKANDFANRKMTAMAKSFYSEIVTRFPGTEAAKKAAEKLGK